MTDKEIKKLAEECSLYYQGRPAKRGYELSNRLTIESYALMTIKWLSERYCIVPKSNATDLCRLIFNNGGSEDYGLIDGLVDWVYDNLEEEYSNVIENGGK